MNPDELFFVSEHPDFPRLVAAAVELFPEIPACLYEMAFDLPIQVGEVSLTPQGLARTVLEWWADCHKDNPQSWPSHEFGGPPLVPALMSPVCVDEPSN